MGVRKSVQPVKNLAPKEDLGRPGHVIAVLTQCGTMRVNLRQKACFVLTFEVVKMHSSGIQFVLEEGVELLQ